MLIDKIVTMMENFQAQEIQTAIVDNRKRLQNEYFTATNLYQELR
jgi:uncharacterized protein YkvS